MKPIKLDLGDRNSIGARASYTTGEIKKLLAAVLEEDVFRPVIILGLFYGLRRSEELRLT